MGRRLGQHFLTDPSILDRIVDALDPDPLETVLEIGPGRGTLTRRLLERVGGVVAIERDRRLADNLIGQFPGQRIVAADALQSDWTDLIGGAPFKVVGNIPYYITSPLIDRALGYPAVTRVVYLVQREVADRLGAAPGSSDYGALTVGVTAVAHVEKLFHVTAGAFRPPPKVDSAVVRLTPRDNSLIERTEREPFRGFVTNLFGRRRKQLVRSLRDVAGLTRDETAAVLTGQEIEHAARVETLSTDRLVRLFRAVAR